MAVKSYTIDIEESQALAFDTFLRKARGEQEPQADGSIIVRPRFPNGLQSWIEEAVGANLRDLGGQLDLPNAQLIQEEIAAKQRQLNEMFRPAVRNAATPERVE